VNRPPYPKDEDFVLSRYDSNLNLPNTKSIPIPVQQKWFPVSINAPDIFGSPSSSPSHSPKPSPHSSPAQSPNSRRKGGSTTKDIQDIYSTTANWLKNIRLHKYSEPLETFSFSQVILTFFIRNLHIFIKYYI